MDHIFLKVKEVLLNKSLQIHMVNRRWNVEETKRKISVQICIGEKLFPPEVKAKNQHKSTPE